MKSSRLIPKHEIRNPKQIQSTNFQMTSEKLCLEHCDFEFLICFEFRTSDFGFAIG